MRRTDGSDGAGPMNPGIDWGSLLVGALALALGAALLVSPNFSELIFKRNRRADAWSAVIGSTGPRFEPRIIAGCLAVLVGFGLLWVGFHPKA
ncbi:hypothetical protein [Methylobacterium trifolii]|uniref:Uncharacterized protein n=1 Tax=Methylobacterium trifolii TaxID=1003092 RepID=A0ABQ4U4W2_9HYPH|nr:hypothetical protein [Methylobacterium trifolii]GJE61806.1 hypothetical protein MPOCJGCO_3932 [Methylobacterium trifolii]